MGRALVATAGTRVHRGRRRRRYRDRRRLAAFDVTVTGVRRIRQAAPPRVCRRLQPPTTSSTASPTSTPSSSRPVIKLGSRLVDDRYSERCAPAACSSTSPRGLLDSEAALAHLNTGHLAGLGIDVFPTDAYPAMGHCSTHPHVVANATPPPSPDYFAAPSDDSVTPRRLPQLSTPAVSSGPHLIEDRPVRPRYSKHDACPISGPHWRILFTEKADRSEEQQNEGAGSSW